jgi:HAD superfamily hydrolase (TIGR01509 family)
MGGATGRPEGIGLVVFDCDGVLVDSERLTVRVEARLLAELGWPVTEAEIVERFVGRSNAVMLAEIEAQLGRPVPEWTELYTAAQQVAFEAELVPVDGVVAVLDELDGWGVPTCVASSGTHDKMAVTLGLTGLWARFDGRIFSATEVAHGKPEPDLFLHAADRMGVVPAECVVVEDSPYGVAAARAAGMRCIALASPLVAADRLVGPGTTVISDLAALPATLATLGVAGR